MNEFACPGPISVDVRVAAGSVEIHAEPRESATVEVEPYDDNQPCRDAAAATRVELAGDTLVISTPEPRGWHLRRSPRVRVRAWVPAGSRGRLRGASASIAGTGEWSQLRVHTASGSAQIERATGRVVLTTASGDARVGQVDGDLTVRSASGDVIAGTVNGRLDVNSASGHVQIDHADADVRVKTVSGNASVGTTRRGTVRVNAVSGDVSIGVAAGTGVWLDLKTVAGRAQSELTLGGGTEPTHDLTLQVRTVSGNIHVRRATPAPA